MNNVDPQLLKGLIETSQEAARALRFLTPEQFKQNLMDVRELGQVLQELLDTLEEAGVDSDGVDSDQGED